MRTVTMVRNEVTNALKYAADNVKRQVRLQANRWRADGKGTSACGFPVLLSAWQTVGRRQA